MTPDDLLRHLESLLFVAAEPAEVAQLASALDVKASEVDAALEELAVAFQARGIRLQRKGSRAQLASAPDAAPYVEKFLGLTATTRLSQAALETLAIIAYRQPITRAEIEALRGVDCDGVLRTLTARQLIIEVERLDTVGHPIRYGTTFEFLRYFGIQRLDELPSLRAPEPPPTSAPAADAPTKVPLAGIETREPKPDEQQTKVPLVGIEASATSETTAAVAREGKRDSPEAVFGGGPTDAVLAAARITADSLAPADEAAVVEADALAEGAG